MYLKISSSRWRQFCLGVLHKRHIYWKFHFFSGLIKAGGRPVIEDQRWQCIAQTRIMTVSVIMLGRKILSVTPIRFKLYLTCCGGNTLWQWKKGNCNYLDLNMAVRESSGAHKGQISSCCAWNCIFSGIPNVCDSSEAGSWLWYRGVPDINVVD